MTQTAQATHMTKIDFTVLTKKEVRSLSGHERGFSARALFELDSLDQSEEEVLIIAPDNLDTMTPSFVQGLFGESVKALGKESFFKHYKFQLPHHLLADITAGVDRLLMSRRLAGGNSN